MKFDEIFSAHIKESYIKDTMFLSLIVEIKKPISTIETEETNWEEKPADNVNFLRPFGTKK